MKIQLASDIHLEFPAAELDIPNAGADVLILSGDICTARDFPSRAKEFFSRHADRFPHIIYLMGNHEHYHSQFRETKAEIEKSLTGLSNVHFLECESTSIDGIAFWGATLWTDCNNSDPLSMLDLRHGMNDYRVIENGKHPLTPETTVAEHKRSLLSLNRFLAVNPGRKVVVCTHHAPSKKSLHPRYKHDFRINGGYSSDLSSIMRENQNIALWTHGHTHDSFDYMEEATRVVCNPAGYQMRAGQFENPLFQADKIIDIG